MLRDVSLTRNSTAGSFSVLVTSPEGRGTLPTWSSRTRPRIPRASSVASTSVKAGVQSTEDRQSDGSHAVTSPQLAGRAWQLVETLMTRIATT